MPFICFQWGNSESWSHKDLIQEQFCPCSLWLETSFLLQQFIIGSVSSQPETITFFTFGQKPQHFHGYTQTVLFWIQQFVEDNATRAFPISHEALKPHISFYSLLIKLLGFWNVIFSCVDSLFLWLTFVRGQRYMAFVFDYFEKFLVLSGVCKTKLKVFFCFLGCTDDKTTKNWISNVY